MGVSLFIVVNAEEPGFDSMVDGKAVGHLSYDVLDRVAKDLGVQSLTAFFSMDPEEIAAMYGEDAENLPPLQWFEPEDGLRSVRAFKNFFAADPTAPQVVEEGLKEFKNRFRADSVARIIEDLVAYENVLTQTKERGLKWHFQIDG